MRQPGKRATSSDVARTAGVSRTTVSFVLNDRPGHAIPEETRRRVLQAASELNYRPHASARTLAGGSSRIVLLVLPDTPVGSGIGQFTEELSLALAERDLTLIIHISTSGSQALPDVCAVVDASAVIALGRFDGATRTALRDAGVGLVQSLDDGEPAMQQVGRLQAEHLIERGHRKIGYALPSHPVLRRLAEVRLRGVTQACEAALLDPPDVRTVAMSPAVADEVVSRWTAQSVTAVCAYNDETAMAVLAGLRARGLRAPDDLAVVGVDDIPVGALSDPPLTTIRFDLHSSAQRRADTVAAALAGRTRPAQAALEPLLVLRQTT
ncbi:LacI family DNA-binding transcriptional regulator [Streptomyces sp. DH41]|uniref:LacI family DNA-binding transcriptional regulator n=1 Tax=Streptomyces sp. DH41 TaxID=3040125 RepID=UPI00244314E3|nr:LacI family DNA-binding transcriptional regulator [Streptomyces sp. DH41]MDG9724366.1 LacI family DNA-binding transcriptional regulator [Streptomyces sp. DH41]